MAGRLSVQAESNALSERSESKGYGSRHQPRARVGHLLHLELEGDIRNLMNGGLSIPNPQLTALQIRTAQQSTLARKFTGTRVG